MQGRDDDLLSRAVEGDREAIVRLFERHGPAVRQGLAGRVPKRWRSVLSDEDVMQQAYADAFMDIGRFLSRSEQSFRRWLGMLARHNLQKAVRALEADKRGGNRRRVEPGGAERSFAVLYEQVARTGSTPSRHVAGAEAKAALQDAIGQLPADYARVVVMYDLEGRPAGEVAEAMERSCGAVFMLRARAHRLLREVLGATGNFFTDFA